MKLTSLMASSPVLANGVIYTGAGRGVYAIRASTGKMLWHSVTSGWFESSPCVVTKQGVAMHSSISGMTN